MENVYVGPAGFYLLGGGGGGGGGVFGGEIPPQTLQLPHQNFWRLKFQYSKSSIRPIGTAACTPACFVLLHCIAFPYYVLRIVSKCHRTTLRRLTFSGGAYPQSPLQIAVVEGLPEGSRA